MMNPRRKRRWEALVTLTAFCLIMGPACGESDSDDTSEPQGQPLTLHFGATVDGEPFACGETYQGLGVTETTFEPFDFRLYISEVELQDEQGQWHALALDQDTPWQYETIALLDFEDGTGRCTNGTEETREIVTGRWIEDEHPVAVRFEIGVPFELNHIDVSTAPSPLNLTAMFWNWLGGYKFIRLEGATEGLANGWQFHLGSTGCQPGPGQGAESCDRGNRITVAFDDFDLDAEEIVFDVAALVADADLDTHAQASPQGCMSGPDDPDCGAIFSAIGLPHGESAEPDVQSFVSLRPR